MDYTKYTELEEELDKKVIHGDQEGRINYLVLYLRSLCDLLEEGSIEKSDVEYLWYIDRFISLEGRITQNDLLLFLGDQRGESDSPFESATQIESMGPYRYGVVMSAFYMLLRLGLTKGGTHYTLRHTLDKWGGPFTSQSIYNYLKSEIYRRGTTAESYQIAMLEAENAVKVNDRNPDFLLAFVKAVDDYCSSGLSQKHDISGLPESRDDLLALAAKRTERATILDPDNPEHYGEWSSILLHSGDFEEAEEKLGTAIRLNEERGTDPDLRLSYSLAFRELRRNRQSAQYTDEILAQARDELGEFKEEISNYRDEIDEYRNQTIRIIGFFAGIVAIVVTSTQLATQVTSVIQAARLILILTGGLVVSFTGLAIVLPTNAERSWWRPLVVLGVGLCLIVLGVGVPSISSAIFG